MRPGDRFADRFELLAFAGSGGMGSVWRARDATTGEEVALKLMHGADPRLAARFVREARVLSELTDPAIVAYVAHGTSERDEPYLAMRWLSGDDLAKRLRRGALTIAETVDVARRVAQALVFAHARGVVHRDIKPSNLFLVGGRASELTILDFGIARKSGSSVTATEGGAMLGTVGYMAPEQSLGVDTIDGRADLFSLGCVLFECATGKPLFAANDPIAVLAKIHHETAPLLRSARVDAPEALERLVARLLAKDPDLRPADANAVLRELGDLETQAEPVEVEPPSPRSRTLTDAEHRVRSVVVVRDPRGIAGLAPTLPAKKYITPREATASEDPLEPLRSLCRDRDLVVRIDAIEAGALVVTLPGEGLATDTAARAAKVALLLREHLPNASLAIVSGRTSPSARDLAEQGLELAQASLPGAIRLDELSAGLLDVRFEVARLPGEISLVRKHGELQPMRRLLGKATRLEGRDRDLATLMATFEECVHDSVARSVLVTASAGLGKSRLAFEFLRRVEKTYPGVSIWVAQGDPVGKSAAFGLLRPLLARTLGVSVKDELGLEREKIRARVARSVDEANEHRVSAFLGQFVGVPFAEEGAVGAELRAARGDAVVMGDRMREAWQDFASAETQSAPLVLLLEDLHWGDVASVKLIDLALRNLASRPLFVVALARPEIDEVFPALFRDRDLQQLRLSPLSPRASERLVRAALGNSATDEVVSRLVERGSGNPFFLEELVRAVATGADDAVPDTVMAMAEARLASLDTASRRVLRAASILGQEFWPGAVSRLLGDDVDADDLAEIVTDLERREIVRYVDAARIGGERAYAFRHAMLREAAYAMLTEADRRLGHLLAGEWLERVSHADVLTCAQHFEQAGAPERACYHYQRAASEALEGNDFEGAIAFCDAAERCGATGIALGSMLTLKAEALRWAGSPRASLTMAARAEQALTVHSQAWWRVMGELGAAAARVGELSELVRVAEAIAMAQAPSSDTGSDPLSHVHDVRSTTLARCASSLVLHGYVELADRLLARLEATEHLRGNATAKAWALYAAAYRARARGDLSGYATLLEQTLEKFREVGDIRSAAVTLANIGYGALVLGDYARAESALTTSLASAERIGLPSVVAGALQNLGLALGRLGRSSEGVETELQALAMYERLGDVRMTAGCHVYLALLHSERGDSDAAEREAHAAFDLTASAPTVTTTTYATLAAMLVRASKPESALSLTRAAVDMLLFEAKFEPAEALLRLAHAQALEATGSPEEAWRVIAEAERKLLDRARGIADDALRGRFLSNVPENASILGMAERMRTRGFAIEASPS